jgi:hypothetical protein
MRIEESSYSLSPTARTRLNFLKRAQQQFLSSCQQEDE